MSSSSIFDHGAAFEEYFRVAFLRLIIESAEATGRSGGAAHVKPSNKGAQNDKADQGSGDDSSNSTSGHAARKSAAAFMTQ
jgi:hypothetical protein